MNEEIKASKKIGEAIKKIRKEKGLSQLELANLIDSSQSHIANIEAGRRRISYETLEKIAQALGVSVAQLLTTPKEKREKLDEVEEITNLVPVAVVSDVPAGGLEGGDVEIIDYRLTPKDMLQGVPKEFTSWWRVVGNSMSPEINPGDEVLVADGSWIEIRNGDRVIAIFDGEKTLKKFYDKGDYIILQPVNDNYEPIIIDKEKLDQTPLYLYKILAVLKKF